MASYSEAEDRDWAITLLRELVAVPSVSGSGREADCQKIVGRELRLLGLDLDIWEPNVDELRGHRAAIDTPNGYANRPVVVGYLRGSGGGRSLALNVHVDVVPVDPGAVWTRDPWGGEVEDGRLYGRGAADMKGGVVAALLALRLLHRDGAPLGGDVVLQSVCDEEEGGNTTLACLLRGHTADATIFLEPTGTGRLVISSRGAQFFRLSVEGEEGGTEYRERLANAITHAITLYHAVEDYVLMRESSVAHPLYDDHGTKAPLAICTIRAGVWPSTVPGDCVMEGTIECLPGEDLEAVKAGFARYLDAVAATDPWLKAHPPRLQWFGLYLEPAAIAPDAPIVRAVQNAAEAETGARPPAVGGGGSDLRLPILYGNSPSVLFGPGGSPVHVSDEWVDLDQVMTSARITARLAREWCGVQPHP